MGGVEANTYEVVIEPRRGWLRLDARELWEYRDLLVLMVRRDLLARYQQTLLGPLWHLLQIEAVALSKVSARCDVHVELRFHDTTLPWASRPH